MADFSALKTSIQNYIKQNGNEEITGNLLQQILLSMVSTLGDSAINDLVTALNAEIANRGNADTTLQGNIDNEATARGNADTELSGRITTLQGVVNGIVANVENGYVYAGIATPSSTPASGKVFYLALTAGTYTNFGATVVQQGINILKYNGSAWSLDSFLGLDDAPTQGSGNLVKSGGVLDSIIKDGSAFDLSAYNNGTTYADLSAALTALNALPAAYKKGGMSFKFVQSSDNKYIQYFLAKKEWSASEADWQKMNLEEEVSQLGQYVDSPEWVRVVTSTEGKILYGVKTDGKFYFGDGCPPQVQEELYKKVDKVDGKSLIDAIYASSKEVVDNPKYCDVKTDSKGRIIEAITKAGRKQFNIPIDAKGISIEQEMNPTFAQAFIDKDYNVLEGFTHDGRKKINTPVDFSQEALSKLKNDLGEPAGVNEIITTIESAYEGSHKMTIVTVKKDGTGDFISIQEAINSITDASAVNQYEVQVFDDYHVTDLKELWMVHSPGIQNTSNTPSEFIAFIVTKDYVHLRGMGGMREVYVESPDIDMPGSCFQNIQTIFVIGNCRVENFIFKIKGGRYAIHQDLSGDRFGLDSFKTTVLKHIYAVHYGNAEYTYGSYWFGTCAQANGVANGQTQIFIDVTWDSYQGGRSFYAHTNERYTLPCRVIMLNCRVINREKYKEPGEQIFYIGDRYSCQENIYYFYNCDMPTIDDSYPMKAGSMDDNIFSPPTQRGTKSYCLNKIIGCGNKPALLHLHTLEVLTFTTKVIGSKIEVIGGTAKDDIFGVEYDSYFGENIYGTTIGGNYIHTGPYSKVHSLPYILGNCQSEPKTLVLKITDSRNVSVNHTITFDKNYMTLDGSDYGYNTTPAISQQEIINEVNSNFSDYFVMADSEEYINSFDDCVLDIVNTGNSPIERGGAMIKDISSGYRGWRLAVNGESPDGFAAHKIATNGIGRVLLADKNLFSKEIFGLISVTKGDMYKTDSNGKLVVTLTPSEASMIAIDKESLCKIYNY